MPPTRHWWGVRLVTSKKMKRQPSTDKGNQKLAMALQYSALVVCTGCSTPSCRSLTPQAL
ncbi:hypothetical protein D3C75_1285930 [compost metagenome]